MSSAIRTFNPAAPDEQVAEVQLLGDAELEALLANLHESARSWSSRASLRADGLTRWARSMEADLEGLSTLVSREVGKPIQEARAEVSRAVSILRYYAQAAFDATGEFYPSPDGVGSLMSERRALGTVAAVTPWNFPVAIPIWKLAPALAYGNTAILKPSSAAVGTAARLVGLATDHLPEGVLGLAVVDSALAGRMLEDSRISGVSFTGSVGTGRRIIQQAARRGVPVQAEMGGLNASVVLDDAAIAPAASTVAQAAMAYAGQKCTATSRVIVSRKLANAFTEALVSATGKLNVGDPMEPSTVIGPLINEAARDTVVEAVSGATGRGGELLIGGTALDRDGWFMSPALVRVHNPQDDLAQVETFGPVAAVLIADSDDHAVELANGTPYGLSAAVFSEDIDRASRVARQLEAGLIRVNASTTGVDFYAPFGGDRASSYGPREQGRAAREFYTTTRTILVNPPLSR